MTTWADFVIVGAIFFIPFVIVAEIKAHMKPPGHWMFRSALRSWSSAIFFVMLFGGAYFQDYPVALTDITERGYLELIAQVQIAFSRVLG